MYRATTFVCRGFLSLKTGTQLQSATMPQAATNAHDQTPPRAAGMPHQRHSLAGCGSAQLTPQRRWRGRTLGAALCTRFCQHLTWGSDRQVFCCSNDERRAHSSSCAAQSLLVSPSCHSQVADGSGCCATAFTTGAGRRRRCRRCRIGGIARRRHAAASHLRGAWRFPASESAGACTNLGQPLTMT